jgi:hypothetical protein
MGGKPFQITGLGCAEEWRTGLPDPILDSVPNDSQMKVGHITSHCLQPCNQWIAAHGKVNQSPAHQSLITTEKPRRNNPLAPLAEQKVFSPSFIMKEGGSANRQCDSEPLRFETVNKSFRLYDRKRFSSSSSMNRHSSDSPNHFLCAKEGKRQGKYELYRGATPLILGLTRGNIGFRVWGKIGRSTHPIGADDIAVEPVADRLGDSDACRQSSPLSVCW